MMRVRKKPVEVEASPIEFVLRVAAREPELLPDWVRAAIADRTVKVYEDVIVVRTLEGNMRGTVGDFLMRGVQGELYPIAGSIFFATYDIITDEEDAR